MSTPTSTYKVRFDFPFNDRDPVPQAPKILHSVFRRLVDSVSDVEFRDVNGIVVDMDNFPQDKATFDTKFNTTVSDQRQRHILLVVEIRSVKTFYALKQFVWNLLDKHTVCWETSIYSILSIYFSRLLRVHDRPFDSTRL
jgi:hypothetical protein